MFVSPRRVVISALSLASVAKGVQVQKADLQLPSTAAENAALVKSMFTEAYDTYKKYAWGHDVVSPINATYSDGRNGWGATIVDALATMYIMSLNDLFDEAVGFSEQIDFSQSNVNETVSVFETTIRYLGGLLSAYELSGSTNNALLEKAEQVMDKMAFAWAGGNTVPYGNLNFTTNVPSTDDINIAEAGSLVIEWSTLSNYTGNDTYRRLAEDTMRHIIGLDDPLPGLAAQCLDSATGEFSCKYVTWGGGSDSYFEYLLKYPLLTGTSDTIFIDEWRLAVDSSIKYLLSTSTVGNYTNLANLDNDGRIRLIGSHLACFHGGNWLYGGKLLNNDTIFSIGLDLVETCWNTYQSTATGIGPEVFYWISEETNYTGGDPPTEADIQFYNEHGWYVQNNASYYVLRPEVLESNFYAWRITGDEKYYRRARDAADSLNNYTKINSGYAGIEDVRVTDSDRIDDTESFFYAEVLKYLYLTFDDPTRFSIDDYVFNTEGQPFHVRSNSSVVSVSTALKVESPKGLQINVTVTDPPAVSPVPYVPKMVGTL